jgi:hypothetical protein
LKNPRKARIASAAVIVASFVAAFATLGGIGAAESAISAIEKQYGKKVTICHKGKTITVSKNAVPAHTKHGDTVGTCAQAKAKKAKKAKAKAEAAKAKEAGSPAPSDKGNSGKGGGGKGKGKGK